MFPNIHVINLSIMAEVLLAEHLFARFIPRRDRYPQRLALSCVLCLLAAFLFPVPFDSPEGVILYGTFLYVGLFLIAGAGLVVCYEESGWNILFCAITGYTIHQLASAFHELGQVLLPFLPEAVVYFFTLAVTVTVCYRALSGGIRRSGILQIDNRKLLTLSALVLLVDVVLGLVCRAFEMESTIPSTHLTLLHFYNGLCCVFVLCLLFSLLANRRLELEVAVMSQLLEEEKKQYQMSRENIEIINLKCHDLKHQIRRLREGAVTICPDSLEELEDAVGIYDAATRTGNDALDVILTEKSLICERMGIHLTCIADGERIRFLSPADVYSLFGNALDNAIEAVGCLEDPEQRNISLHIQARGRLLSIHVENTFQGTLSFEDGLPRTTKEDQVYHGFGMKSMRLIAERYGGCLTADASGGIFLLDVMIPIPGTGVPLEQAAV